MNHIEHKTRCLWLSNKNQIYLLREKSVPGHRAFDKSGKLKRIAILFDYSGSASEVCIVNEMKSCHWIELVSLNTRMKHTENQTLVATKYLR